MQKLKSTDYKILAALMRNAKISDRQLAKEIGVSQPTVTRRRARLEKEAIDGYTAVPNWKKLGYEILAFTFIKRKPDLWVTEKYKVTQDRAKEWLKQQSNVLMSGGCRGMNMSAFFISVHKNYADFDKFMTEHRMQLGDMATDIESIIVNLGGQDILKPFHLKYLAEAE